MGYRKFKLKNSLDQEYLLTDQNYKHFFNSPSGLGIDKNLTVVRLGNRNKITKREYEFPTIRGELLFYDSTNEDKYDAYNEFVRFASFYPLRLFYYTPGNNKTEEEADSIFISCEIDTINKSEVSHSDSMLHASVTFKTYSFWLSGKESILEVDVSDADKGQFTFPLSFPFAFGTDPLRDLKFNSKGTLNTPIMYRINGECTNPYIRFFDENGEEYAASKINGTYDFVEVNADAVNEYITLRRQGATIANPINMQDLTIGNPDEDEFFLTFLQAKPGVTKATVSFGNDFKGTVTFFWRDEYAGI